MNRFASVVTLLLASSGSVFAADVRVDRFDRAYNAAADEIGSGLRLQLDRCSGRLCYYVADRGVTADVAAPAPGKALDAALLRLPAGFGQSEVAAIFETFVVTVAPDSSFSQRDVFMTGLYEQLAAHGARSEGRFRDWTIVLRDDRDQLRIIAER